MCESCLIRLVGYTLLTFSVQSVAGEAQSHTQTFLSIHLPHTAFLAFHLDPLFYLLSSFMFLCDDPHLRARHDEADLVYVSFDWRYILNCNVASI